MKRIFTAAIAVAGIALAVATARATTFPSLTTIYFAAGVIDDNTDENLGIATFVSCSNLSGQTASVRYQFRRKNGGLAAGGTLLLANLLGQTVATQGGVDFLVDEIVLPTDTLRGGTLQILSTQSAIYCTAMLINAAAGSGGDPSGIALHMVRLNPHPGTVE